MPLLDAESYESIRKALDLSIDKGDLPDEVIALDLYSGEAERWVTSQITISGPEATGSRAKLAAIYMAAALLAPAVTQIVSQKDATGETVTLKTFDPNKKESQMRARAAEMIALVNGSDEIELATRSAGAVVPMRSCVTILCPRCRHSRCVCGPVLIF